MFKVNYVDDSGKIVTKEFNSVKEAYFFVVENIATDSDKEFYKECCGETFLSVLDTVEDKEKLMKVVLRNGFENVVLTYQD